jgi:hypothetical protein
MRARYHPLAAVTLIASLGGGFALADDQSPAVAAPLPWIDPAPPGRLFLQQPFERPEVLKASELELSARLLYANIILVRTVPEKVSYTFDEETGTLVLGARYGLGDLFEVGAAIPVVLQYGGFLDGPIEFVEKVLGQQNPTRFERPRNLTVFQITLPNGRTVERLVPGVGLGDLALTVKGQLMRQQCGWPALGLSLSVKFPTGGATYGSGEVDLGGAFFVGWTVGRFALRFAFIVAVPTVSSAVIGIPTRVYGAIEGGLAVELGAGIALHFQGAAHRPPLALPSLGENTYYVLFGLTAALSPSLRLETGVAENVFSPGRGADISFLFGVRGEI